MQGKIYSYPLLIKENHLDAFGHVNNATYLSILEEARWEIITNNGYGLKEIIASGLAPTILEIKINFLKELRLRQEIIIHTQLIYYERKIAKLEQKITRKEEICCTAEFTLGLFSLKERKIIEPTPEWLRALGVVNSSS